MSHPADSKIGSDRLVPADLTQQFLVPTSSEEPISQGRMYRLPRYQVVLVTLIIFLLTACSGNNTTPAPAATVFTSTPVTQAVEGSPYSYQLAVNGTAALRFSLTERTSRRDAQRKCALVDTHGRTIPSSKQLHRDCDRIRQHIGDTVLGSNAIRYYPRQPHRYVLE